MKKLAAVFVIAVLGPSVALAWLATRSLRDQEIVVHSQRALLQQGATDALSNDLNVFLDDVRVFYGRLLEDLISEVGPEELSTNFDEILRSRWSQAAIGAAVTESGDWLNPSVTSTDPEIRRFLRDTQPFLLNGAPSEVYLAPATTGNVVTVQEMPAADWFSRFSDKREPMNESSPGIREVKASGALEKPVEAAESKPRLEAKVEAMPAPVSAPPALSLPPPATASAAPSLAKEASEKSLSELNQGVVLQQKVAVTEDRYRNRSSYQQRAPVAQTQEPLQAEEAEISQGAGLLQMADSLDASDSSLGRDNRTRNVTPLGQLEQLKEGGQYFRLTEAANNALADNPNRQSWSALDVNTGQLRELMADDPEGAISRFVSGGLQILLWRRDPAAPGKVFWVELNIDELKRDLTGLIRETAQRMGKAEVSLALLDANGQVVAQTSEGFTTDWRQPFVATEVGEILPHWEVAAYLLDPRAVARTARSARLTIWMLVPILLAAIGIGGVLIIRDIGREMHLARQKTDFVSNVSHELKTPLTSIRMFSDLLGNRRDMADEKRLEYSGIISREAARLSRLINNLLDFSRMERGEKRYRMERFELGEFVRETVNNYRHQIEAEGFQLTVENHLAPNESCEIEGDRDALSQVLLNLLSNAEKYGGDTREITVEIRQEKGDQLEIAVLDRGPGIARKHAHKIFEKFYRADDSLSSGIEGSGLGLTLARQIARTHKGDVEFRSRLGGGSCFLLRLPLISSEPS